jgi:hypothetical protein
VLFRQRAESNLRQWTIRPVHLGVAEGGPGAQPALFEAGLQKALGHGSKIYVIIYPYHAEIRLMMEKVGLTPLFGEWKRQLVAAVERHSAGGNIELWDFSGLTPQTSEAIPEKNDRRTHMVYYWEAGHFKKAMGDLVMGRLLGQDTGVGVRLHAGNVEAVVREDAARVRQLAETPSPLQQEVDSLFAR